MTFVATVDNPYFPLAVGATWTYEAETEEGTERIEVVVEPETRTIQGVIAIIVKDTVYLDDVIIEDTFDWYAQDEEGNVDGALPGIIMPAEPTVDGQPYYQEYDEGEAEDAGEVIATGVEITVPAGSFTDCITTRDFSTLDPTLEEKKTYCPGVGNVFVEEPDASVELLTATGLQ